MKDTYNKRTILICRGTGCNSLNAGLLHEKLAKKWPAARTRKIAAGVKLGVVVSAVANIMKNVSFFRERTHDIKTLRIGP